MGKGLKNILLVGALSASLFNANPALAEEPKSKIDLTINYNTKIPGKNLEYEKSDVIYGDDGNLYLSENAPEITPFEKLELELLLYPFKDDIKDIDAYQHFMENPIFSENQKLILLAAISQILYDKHYSSEGGYVCRHISSDIEELAENAGIKTDVVAGRTSANHAYDILKLENGRTAIIDGGDIFISDSKNVEKLLEMYQKDRDAVAFQHLFYDKNKFKYRLITRDGRNFLDFIGYDESLQSLKNSLFKKTENPASTKIILDVDNYQTAVKVNSFGFFAKIGTLEKMFLSQIGYDFNFSIFDIIDLHPNANFVCGNLHDTSSDNFLWGFSGDLTIKTNNKQGINFSSRTAGEVINRNDSTMFYDFLSEIGNSYKISLGDFNLNPYCIAQLGLVNERLNPNASYAFNLRELKTGIVFDAEIDDINFSIDPYYILKNCEQGFGAEIKFGNKNLGINLEGDFTKSGYDFCPDKFNFSASLYIPIKNFNVNFGYENKTSNYDGEIDSQNNIFLNANIKF